MDWPKPVNQILGKAPKPRSRKVLRDGKGPRAARLGVTPIARKASGNEELVKIASKLKQPVEKLSES